MVSAKWTEDERRSHKWGLHGLGIKMKFDNRTGCGELQQGQFKND